MSGGLFGQPITVAGDQEIVRSVKLALRPKRQHPSDHAHKKFAQPQLFACLILKACAGEHRIYDREESAAGRGDGLRGAGSHQRVGAFDCEEWQRANREDWGVPSYAPTTVRSVEGRVNGMHGNAYQSPVKGYGRRWMCESVNSGIKRTSGGTLRSHKENTLFPEAALNVAAYTIKV